MIGNACLEECPERWCECVYLYDPGHPFTPPPLCASEIEAIIRLTGRDDFYASGPEGPYLRQTGEGYCIFYDRRNKLCRIYDVRPVDCRIFPVDFMVTDHGEAWWILWNCPLSRRMDDQYTEDMLRRYEREYASQIRETWAYGNDVYADMGAGGRNDRFRRLRPVRLAPAASSAEDSPPGEAHGGPKPGSRRNSGR